MRWHVSRGYKCRDSQAWVDALLFYAISHILPVWWLCWTKIFHQTRTWIAHSVVCEAIALKSSMTSILDSYALLMKCVGCKLFHNMLATALFFRNRFFGQSNRDCFPFFLGSDGNPMELSMASSPCTPKNSKAATLFVRIFATSGALQANPPGSPMETAFLAHFCICGKWRNSNWDYNDLVVEPKYFHRLQACLRE